MSVVEQRRFPRAQLRTRDLHSLLQARVIWPNQEVSDVFDLSYKGAAVRRPGLYTIADRAALKIEVHLGESPVFSVAVNVVWSNLDTVGLAFEELPAEGHQAMAEFLDAQLLGSQLKRVQRFRCDVGQSFHVWLAGPQGVHVFIWLNSAGLMDRVDMDFGDRTIHFERGRARQLRDRLEHRAWLLLSQLENLPVEEFLRTLTSENPS